jgi:hypothetical protein
MSNDTCIQSGWSCEELLREAAELRVNLEELLPTYLAAVRSLDHRVEHFERRGSASWVDTLVGRVRADYERWQVARQQVDLFSKFATTMVDLALVAARQQPMPPPTTPSVSIAILPNGEVRPALAEEFEGRRDIALLSWEEFEQVARNLRQDILQGKAKPNREEDVARLIYKVALPARENGHR